MWVQRSWYPHVSACSNHANCCPPPTWCFSGHPLQRHQAISLVIIFGQDKNRGQNWVAPSSSHVFGGLCASRTCCVSGEQMDWMQNESWQFPEASHPACRARIMPSSQSNPAGFWKIGSWNNAYPSSSSHKTPQKAIIIFHISQQNHTLLTAKWKGNTWEFALSVQKSSPDKTALAAFEMLKSGGLRARPDSPSPAQARWELLAAAETSFEREQWKLLCS